MDWPAFGAGIARRIGGALAGMSVVFFRVADMIGPASEPTPDVLRSPCPSCHKPIRIDLPYAGNGRTWRTQCTFCGTTVRLVWAVEADL